MNSFLAECVGGGSMTYFYPGSYLTTTYISAPMLFYMSLATCCNFPACPVFMAIIFIRLYWYLCGRSEMGGLVRDFDNVSFIAAPSATHEDAFAANIKTVSCKVVSARKWLARGLSANLRGAWDALKYYSMLAKRSISIKKTYILVKNNPRNFSENSQ